MKQLIYATSATLLISVALAELGRFSWFAALFEHFRVQYAVALFLLIPLLAVRKQYGLLSLLSFAFLLNAFNLAPFFFTNSGQSNQAPQLTAISVNLLTTNRYKDQAVKTLLKKNPDLLAVVEVDQNWVEALSPLKKELPHSIFAPRGDNYGIGLLSRYPMRELRIETYQGAPFVQGILLHPSGPIFVLAVHSIPPVGRIPSRANADQIVYFARLINASPEKKKIVLGDLNQTPWSSRIQKLKRSTGLRDSSLLDGYQISWTGGLSRIFGLKLDFIFHSAHLEAISTNTGPSLGSDHLPITTTFSLER